MPIGATFLGGIATEPRTAAPRMSVVDEQSSFRGGLNTVSAEDALQPDQFRRGDNGRLTPYGAFIKRGGTQRTAGALIAVTTVQNGYTWYQGSGTALTMAVCGGTLFTAPYGSFPLTWTQRGSVGDLSTTVTPSLAQFLNTGGTDSVYIADGGLLNRYTGTTLTPNIPATPTCTVLAVHNERLWGTGVSTSPQSIYYSALNNGDTLGIGASLGGQIIIRTFGDQQVTGLISLGTSLMIFHQSGVSRLTGFGQDDITVQPAGITGEVGTLAPQSIVRLDNVVYFVAMQGLYAATEQDVTPVATPTQPDVLAPILDGMTYANIANIRSVVNRATREVLIMIPGFGVYVYNTVLKAWAGPWIDGYLSPEVNCLFESQNASGYPIVLRGDVSGFVSECDRPDVFLDNVVAAGTGGTTFASALQPRRFYGETDGGRIPHISKAWRYAYVLASLNGSTQNVVGWTTETASSFATLPASMTATWGGSGTMWGSVSSVWGAPAQTSFRVDIDGHGYFIDITLTDSGAALPIYSQCRVEGFALGRR